MPEATCLADLLKIRNARKNRKFFKELDGCLGTAVGYRYSEKEQEFEEKDGKKIPAILVFVKEKIPFASLDPEQVVPEYFEGPGGLRCRSDVMVGEAPDRPLDTGSPDRINRQLQRDLHKKDLGVIGGIPILGPETIGTGGCVVRLHRGGSGAASREPLGVLTNFHIAGFKGTRIYNGGGRLSVLGETEDSIAMVPAKDPDGHPVKPHSNNLRVDLGLIRLDDAAARHAKSGVYKIEPLGAPYGLDLTTMGPIGEYVVGVGQALGRQEGRIMAFAYEWRNDLDTDEWIATDYLILSTTNQPFAAPGDSGKLVVTNARVPRPIAVLWGGERHDFWNVPAQASCAYATDINLALRLFKASIH